jgi:hypothetical protein
MTKRRWSLFVIVVVVFLAIFWSVAVNHQTPPGQPPLADVTQQSLTQLKQEFNASPDSERVVLLLSPTCPVCVEGSSAVNAVLKRHPGSNVRVFVIWEPILPTDWNKPMSVVLHRLSDTRAIQIWDKQHQVAGPMEESAPDQHLGCCKRNGTLWDIIAVYPPGAQWTDSLPASEFFAGPVVRGAPQWDVRLLQQ